MQKRKIKKFALICTRDANFKAVTSELISYLYRAGVEVKVLVGKKSIFSAYEEGFAKIKEENELQPDDIIILCHDDIEILNSIEHFNYLLDRISFNPESGFHGPAGTTYLSESAVWWDQEQWKQGKHRGFVLHGKKDNYHSTYYGDYGQVVVLDGLFLACTVNCLNISIGRPDDFKGDWDFYDIQYTASANAYGLKNMASPFFIRHESMGELVGRTSWELNRQAFIKRAGLPITL